jgi:hypothetical protein
MHSCVSPELGELVYCIGIGQPLFDRFYNSVNGYRAAYFVSEETGLEANAAAVEALRPILLREAGGYPFTIDADASLRATH